MGAFRELTKTWNLIKDLKSLPQEGFDESRFDETVGLGRKLLQTFGPQLNVIKQFLTKSEREEAQQSLRKYWPETLGQLGEFEIAEKVILGSIGRVYQLKLLKTDPRFSTNTLAIKTRLPEIEEVINDQMSPAKVLLGNRFFEKLSGFETKEFVELFDELFKRETNFLLEQNCLMAFQDSSPWVSYPVCFPHFSTDDILVSEWTPSVSLDSQSLTSKEKKLISESLYREFLHQILNTGNVQCDWNIGNWGWDEKRGKLIGYDVASVFSLDSKTRRVLKNFLIDGPTPDLFQELGFSANEFRDFDQQELAEIIRSPFNCRCLSLEDLAIGQRIKKVLGPDHMKFRKAGPAWFMLLMRAYYGFSNILKKLGQSIEPVVLNTEVLREEGFGRTFKTGQSSKAKSFHLFIEITSPERKIGKFSFPVHSLKHLDQLIPQTVWQKLTPADRHLLIQTSQIDPRAIEEKTEILNRDMNGKEYRIWLESAS